MRRAVARGRLFPQSYSTDRRYGRLSLKAIGLFPLIWANADDQGRLCGDPEEIKYAVCPNIDHITKTDIPEVLAEIEKNGLLKVYDAGETPAIQLLDWWDVHRPQWAYPSQYPPPEGWKDRLRYHRTPTEVIMENWVPPGQYDRELPSALPSSPLGVSGSALPSAQSTLSKRNYKKESGKEKGVGDIKVPSALGSTTPSPASRSPPTEIEILDRLTECFKREWGKVPAEALDTVLPREPTARESAQLRDLAKELSAAGGCTLKTIEEAFRHVAEYPGKMHISYVRAILLKWLGVPRAPP